MPKVSVIIPTFNRAKFIGKAIDSALNQTFKNREIIVVDDGSTDGTASVLKAYGQAVRCINQLNGGVSAARNTGIREATGEWLAFLDSDDEWTEEYLSKQINLAEELSRVCMQTADCVFIGQDGRKNSYFEMNGAAAEFKGEDYLFVREPFSFVIRHGPWQVGSTVIRREAMRNAGLFDTSLTISEDLDLMARVALQGPFGMIREGLVHIYRREEAIECLTQQARDNPIKARESDDRIYEKLASIEELKYTQRKVLTEIMSANRRAIGNLLLKEGRVTESRNSYKRAFSMDHSIRSFGRYVLSWICAVAKSRVRALGVEDSGVRSGKLR